MISDSNKDGYIFGQSVFGCDKEFKDYVLKQDDYIIDQIKDKNGNEIIFKHKSIIFTKNVTIMRDGIKNNKTNVYQKKVYYSDKYARKQKRKEN